MKHLELEQELRAHIRKRRIIEATLSVAFLAITILFAVLYAQSAVVEEISWGPIKHQTVTYNHNYSWGVLVGILGLTPSLVFWVADGLFSRLVTFEVSGDFVTFYRGIVHTNLYVNGVLNDSVSYRHYLEAPLSDGSKVNVALGKWSAHFTFSNGHPSMDV